MKKTQEEIDKQRAQKLLYKIKQKEEFEASLPLRREIFFDLFEFLYNRLYNNSCDSKLTFTKLFINKLGLDNEQEIITWINEHGGYCDCEVLANVEEKFEV